MNFANDVNDGIEVSAPQPTEITMSDNGDGGEFGLRQAPIQKAVNAFDLPAFSGSVLRECVNDSVECQSSNLAQKGVRLVDQFHEWDCETYSAWKLNINDAPNDIPELVKELSEEVYERLFDVWATMTDMMEIVPPQDAIDHDNILYEFALWAAERKLVYESYRGAYVEQYVQTALEEAYDVTVLIHSDDVKEASGIDNPESNGIDAYIPKFDTTLQIKEGSGGNTQDESELIARYNHENGMPTVTVNTNE